MTEETFTTIMERARDGDRQALDDLLAGHIGGLRAYVRLKSGALIRERESCSDLVQSVCREALADLHGFRGDSERSFRQWLYTMAMHKITDRLDYYRAARRDARRDASADADLAPYVALCTPSQDAVAREEIARIEHAFDKLPEAYREVILEARFLGRSVTEIAERTDRTEDTVRRTLSRARARLAVLLG